MSYQIKDKKISKDVEVVDVANVWAKAWTDSVVWGADGAYEIYKNRCRQKGLNHRIDINEENKSLYWEAVYEKQMKNEKYIATMKDFHDEYVHLMEIMEQGEVA